MNGLLCLFCLIDIAEIADAVARNDLPKNTAVPDAQQAMTLAPMWQTTMLGPHQAVACVAVPACPKHVEIIRHTIQDEPQGANVPEPNGHLERGEADVELQ